MHIEHDDSLILSISVKTPDALNQAHGIPRKIEAGHDMVPALEVDTLPTGLGQDEELALILEVRNLSNAFRIILTTMDKVDLIVSKAVP